MSSRKSEYERAIVDRDAVEQAVQAAMASAGVGQLDLGPLGTSGQSVMEGEPVTLAADPVAPVFDRSDVAGSLAAGLVPTQADLVDLYTPYILGSKNPQKTFADIKALEEAGYPLMIEGTQIMPTSDMMISGKRFIDIPKPPTLGSKPSLRKMPMMDDPRER